MGRLNRILFGTGLCFLLFSAVWLVVIAPRVLHSHAEYATSMNYEAWANSRAALTEPLERSHFSEHHQTRIRSVDGTNITLETSTAFTEMISGTVLYESTDAVRYDHQTWKISGSEALVRFPFHLAPRDYLLKQFSYFPESGVLFRFQGAERVGDVEVYRFDYEASGLDWTESYDYDLDDAARIKTRDWGSAWVDPSTGLLIQHTEEWSARVSGGAHDGLVVDEGRMWLAPDTITKQLFNASNHHRIHILYEILIPIALAICGLVAILLSFSRKRR